MKANSMKEAWKMADEIFATDYMKDEKASANAGYPVYWSTAEGVNAWISDLGNRLEVNQGGKSINIWIEEQPAEDQEERAADIRTEKTVRVSFETTECKRNTETTVKASAAVDLGINSKLSEIVQFSEDVKRIVARAVKAVKAGNSFSLEVTEAQYKWTGDRIETIDFNAWTAAPVWEQAEEYVYLRPDTRYTAEHRDMILTAKNTFRDMAEYIG